MLPDHLMKKLSHFALLLCLTALSACSLPPGRTAAPGLAARLESAAPADNATVEAVVTFWQAQDGAPESRRRLTLEEGGSRWEIDASWPAGLPFDRLVPVRPMKERELPRQILREGAGVPYLAIWDYSEERKKTHPFLSEGGYITPVTVTLDQRAPRRAGLRIHDPRAETSVMLAGSKKPLAADWSAVSEHILYNGKKQKIMPGLAALRNSQKYIDKLGLLSLEPPAKDRIPVIFVHGLMSRPLTWHNAFNELGFDPDIQKNYQLYFFRYPSGVPVVYSSAKFRQQLSLLETELEHIGNRRAKNNMVLIGHSMGGLVSKLQVTSSGDRLWVNLFGAKPADLGLSQQEYDNFKEYLEFHPNPHIDRVVFVCTPHRGSKMAVGFIGAVGRRLISLPGNILGNTFDLLQGQERSNPVLGRMLSKGIPSSIDNLSPESTFVKQSVQLPLKPGLHVHSIIGNKDGRALDDPKCSDGVVPYRSAHLDGVESELVVPSNHGAHETEAGISEMRRILLLHLKQSR